MAVGLGVELDGRMMLPHYEVGGAVYHRLLPPDVLGVMQARRYDILALGKQDKEHGPYKHIVDGFLGHVRHEPFNGDWKIVGDKDGIANVANIAVPGAVVESGNTTTNKGLNGQMVTFSRVREDGTSEVVRVSVPGRGDRRWPDEQLTGLPVTRQQQVVVDPKGEVVDMQTGERIEEIGHMPLEELPQLELELQRSVVENMLIQLSRFYLNAMRGLNLVRPSGELPFAYGGTTLLPWPARLADNIEWTKMIDSSVIEEVTYRLMASYCLNPREFAYLASTSHFGLAPLFPFFGELRHLWSDISSKLDTGSGGAQALEESIRVLADREYKPEISVIGNLASWFEPAYYIMTSCQKLS